MKFRKEKAKQPPSQPQGMTVEQAIGTAYAHWNAGQAQQAEYLCQQVLAVWPEHPDALHLLGLLAHGFGNLDSALGYMRRACAAPRAPVLFHSNLAEMLRQGGLLIEAETVGRRAVALDARSVAGWGNLGIILQEAGKLEESLQCLARVCQLVPDNAQAHNNLGNTYKRLGRLNEARTEYETAIRLDPSYSEVHSNLAVLLNDLGDHDAAMQAARRAIEINPRNADAYLNAAVIAITRRRPDEAARWIENILSFAPEHPGALLILARSQQEDGDFLSAEQTARRAVAVAPQNGAACEVLGQVLQAMGRLDEARAEYERAATLPMPNPEAPVEKQAILLLQQNRDAEALAVFDAALTINPRAAGIWFHRCEAKTFVRNDPDIAAMEQLLTDGRRQGISRDERVSLLFALGKACLDTGEDDRAFAFLDEANRQKRSISVYDADVMDKWLDSIVATVGTEQVARLTGHGDPTKSPVFIVGMPRSGITLIERLLVAHPLVRGVGGLNLIPRMMTRISGTDRVPLGYPRLIESTAPEDLSRLARHYLDRVSVLAPGKPRLVDKMPANLLYAGFIHALFPNAHIIHCRRDPMDTCLSCYARPVEGEQELPCDLADLGRFHRGYERLAAHWKRVLPADRYTEVRYEDAMSDPGGEARRLIGFCGLDWDGNGFSGHDILRSPVHSAGRWKRYATHLDGLFSALGIDASR